MTKEEITVALADLGADFEVVLADHGWRADAVRVDTSQATFLIWPNGRLNCVGWENTEQQGVDEIVPLDRLRARLLELVNHECMPWGG